MYYPEQRAISPYTTIQREVLLPDEASAAVRVNEGKRVDIRDVVAQGIISNGFVIIDAAKFFGLRSPDKLEKLMQVNMRDLVNVDDVLAGKNPRRGKRLFSPVRGIVARVADGRIVLQKAPTVVDLEAGVRGKIMQVRPGRGVVIESMGARVQGVWGNNRNVIATMRLGPKGDLAAMGGDSLERRFTGSIILLKHPITHASLNMMTEQGFAGIIAPSMDPTLRPMVLNMSTAVLLTEGFGDMQMSGPTFGLLSEFDGNQVTLDAAMPGRWETRTPEIVINVPSGDRQPSRPNPRLALKKGMTVRLMREPHRGAIGEIMDLPESRVLLDNGLRAMCAQVQLVAGGQVNVPLANLEVLGR